MSEFQQYQFRAIDQPLAESQRKEVNSWSSRASASSTSVTFTYHYGDFKKDEKKAMEEYFDAMLYVANWGTKRLMFRFPRKAVDEKAMLQYTIVPEYAESYLDFYTSKNFIILDISLNEEDGGGWIEDDEYDLSDFLSIREDIIQGDYRSLFICRLKIAEEDQDIEKDEYEETEYEKREEPPVPPGLKKGNATLKALQDFFNIDEALIKTWANKSEEIENKKIDYASLINQLSSEEKNDYLLRLIRKEPRLDIILKKRLEKAL